MSLKSLDQVRFEGYTVDHARYSLEWQNERIPLSRKTFDLLIYLIDHRDSVAGKEELLSSLWPKQVVEESNLTQQIFVLRKALSRHSSGAKIIETVPGSGYRFAAQVEPPPQAVATPSLRDQRDDLNRTEAVAETRPTSRRLRNIMVGLAVMCLLGIAIYVWSYWQNRSSGAPVAVVLSDFAGTGDARLDSALRDALRIDLKQSPFVSVVAPGTVRDIVGQMGQPADVALTPAIAREVCERASAQVVVTGLVSRFGQKYLLSLSASGCLAAPHTLRADSGGDVLAEAKTEVDRADDLPHALDGLAATLRRGLGESRASIHRSDAPLFVANTGSLEALKAWSEGTRIMAQGNARDAKLLFERAVTLDPEFGVGWADLAATYAYLTDYVHEREALSKAYALRDRVPALNRLYLTALYYDNVKGDVAKSLETYKTMAALYPQSSSAAIMLGTEYDAIGQAELGIADAKRALELPRGEAAVTYQNLALIQLHAGQAAAAQKTCETAIAHHFDSAEIHDALLIALVAQHDMAGARLQIAWGHEHPDAMPLQLDEATTLLWLGQAALAGSRLEDLSKTSVPPDLIAEYQRWLMNMSRMLAEDGLRIESLHILAALPTDALNEDALVALALDGKEADAESGLARLRADNGQRTIWKNVLAPQIQAAISLAQHKPDEAIRALEPARAFEGLALGPVYLRGQAYLELAKPDLALREFQKVVEHPYTDPLSVEISLSVLGEARAYAQKSDVTAAVAQYRKFFDAYQSADPDLPPLQAARTEVSRLMGGAEKRQATD
jgi:DNA-binding winged helix-turn-helix (wHTH) protein/tetratricopeptide (TPR) repeat protein